MPRLLTDTDKEIRSKIYLQDTRLHRPNYAYFTLLFNDDCLPAAMMLGWSLRKSRTENDLVVMVTASIGKRSRGHLRKVFDRVVDVDIIKLRDGKGGGGRRKANDIYAQRMTKCNLFQFIEYKKIIYIEISIYTERNFDDLFEMDAPAGISSLVTITDQDNWHGLRLPCEHVIKSLHVSRGIRGCLMLLKPSMSLYHHCQSITKYKSNVHFIYPDEEIFTKMFINSWTHIHAKFALVPWQVHRVSRDIYGICLESFEPWQDKCKDSTEVLEWRRKIINMLNDIPSTRTIFKDYKWLTDLETSGQTKQKDLFLRQWLT